MFRRVRLACALAGLTAATLAGEPAMVDVVNVPVDRLVRNLETLAAQEPGNVRLRVNLARLHAMAYALHVAEVPVVRNEEARGPFFGTFNNAAVPFTPKPAPEPAAAKTAAEHLTKALAIYREALAIVPADLVANLGYAWCLAQSGDTRAAVNAYRRTISYALQVEVLPLSIEASQRSITEEAATFLIPLLDATADADEIARLRKRIEMLNSGPRWITPIAVPLRTGLQAADLLDEQASVAFDADGSGLRKRWTWITSDAGWLVQDTRQTGSITSALQMFGSVSWWLFWDNGYDALRALDDNRDGELNGRELNDLAIWKDANANGVSEPGEVRPLGDWRIVALSYAQQQHDPSTGIAASSPAGVTFADGTTRPTFDLILRHKPTS